VLRLVAACVGDTPDSGSSGGGTDAGNGTDSAGGGNDGGGGGNDAGSDGAIAVDAGRCDPKKPFGMPINVPNVNSGSYDNYVALTADEQTMYIATNRNGDFDIYVATWSTQTNTFGTPMRADALDDNGGDERAPSVSSDGNRIFFRSNRTGTTGFNDIWTTSRNMAGVVFPTPGKAENINSTADDVDPSLQANGTKLYFASDRNGGGASNYQIFESTITAGTTGTPMPVTTLGKGIRFPVISADGLTLYYGNVAEIYASTRADDQSAFPGGSAVPELNSDSEDEPGWISHDNCVMYFMSDRPGGMGSLDIWVAKRPK